MSELDERHISVLLRTTEHRGDHDAEIAVAYQAEAGETVAELVQRLMTDHRPFSGGFYHEAYIELRVVKS